MIQPRSDFFFFWKNLAFSQWGVYPMVIDGVRYSTCEQNMMAEKARLFGDSASEAAIMATSSPREQKALGRRVQGFSQRIWGEHAREIVYRANLAKFSQHLDLQRMLLATGDKIIAEASPYDLIWGIGLEETDPRACDPERWRGRNWLGEALMRVRAELCERQDSNE